MRRIGGLWPQITAFENLLLAYHKARQGKRYRDEVARFDLNLEANLLTLRRELLNGCYCPGPYRQFTLYDRKPRLISAAPFRDRVVHHALMNLVEPALDPTFIHDSYACRTGKGVHAAVRRYQGWAGRFAYVLKLDVSRYFPSIDHAMLKDKLGRRIKDRPVLALLHLIIDHAPDPGPTPFWLPGEDLVDRMQRRLGLPIGNLTSQFLGNLYLDDLDHYLKEVCGVRGYLRYVDDLVLLDDDKPRLWALRDEIARHLAGDRLVLHPHKQQVRPTAMGADILGYRVFPDLIRLRRDNGYRFRRRLCAMARDFAAGRIEFKEVDASVAAWVGHARHADSLGLRRAVLGGVSFCRARGRTTHPACAAGRLLEQQPEEAALRQPQQEQRG